MGACIHYQGSLSQSVLVVEVDDVPERGFKLYLAHCSPSVMPFDSQKYKEKNERQRQEELERHSVLLVDHDQDQRYHCQYDESVQHYLC